MNERIQELIKQATHVEEPDGLFPREVFDKEKFAELIVRECAKALDDKLANPNGASMAWCDGSDLLEHFGVKE